MDIDLLSKMVSELIMDNDRVALPGLGEFVSQMVPSSITDKGYTINPPYRKLVFRPSGNDDGLLASLYAESNGVSAEVAARVIKEFVDGMKAVLREKKVVVFPGLGRLRATRENNVFFVADEELDLFPECFGMSPVSLKSRRVEKMDFAGLDIDSPEAAAAAEDFPAPPAEAAPVPCIPETECVENPRRAGGRKVLAAVGIAAGIAGLALGAFILAARLAPDFVDRILYTEEELEIINYGK